MTRELSPETRVAIARQHDGPWCAVCGNSMPQAVRDLGYDTHPVCGPHDLPNPVDGQAVSSLTSGRIVGSKVAGQSVNSDRPTAPLGTSERNG